MQAVFQSFLLVFVSEMGDKTQLLAMMLAARFRAPGKIMAGILVATLANHALASWAGAWISHWVPPQLLSWILAATFIGFGLWILVPDKEEEVQNTKKWGAFLTTLVLFFLAEMGDKTQLATVALGARFSEPVAVTAGTTLGMMAADGLAIVVGQKIPLRLVRWVACALFFLFGLGILFFT